MCLLSLAFWDLNENWRKSLEFICARKTQSSGLLILEVSKWKIIQNILVVLQEQFILYKKQVLKHAKRFINPGKVD